MKVVLELGCNHNGSIATAKRIIDDAARLKVWGVKLQKRDMDSIPKEVASIPRNISDSFGFTYTEHRAFLEFNEKQINELKSCAEDRGLKFVVSVFDLVSMKSMIDYCQVKYIKLPSQFLCNPVMNNALLQYNVRIMHSTGMHTTNEVIENGYLLDFDVTFYCRSVYPFPRGYADIGSAIKIFDIINKRDKCGYSSHDKDGLAIPFFVIAGAQWLERHYTLDKNMKGSDHGTVSSDFCEMKNILRSIDSAYECLYANKLCDEEKRIRDMYIGKGV